MKKKIDYVSIIKEAINITLKNRLLWWFGFLAMFGGGFGSFNYTLPNNSSEERMDEMEIMNMMRRAAYYWDMYKEWIILGIVVVLLILIGLYVLGLIGRGGLIDSIFKVTKKEIFSFSSGFKRGLHFLGRIFLIDLFFSLAFLVSLFVLAFPVVRLFMLKSYGVAISLGIVAILLFVSIGFLFFYLRKYAQMYLVSSDVNVSDSLKLSYKLFEKNIKESLIMGVLVVATNFVVGIGFMVLIMVLLVPSAIIGVIVYNIGQKPIMIAALVLAIILFVGIMMFISSVVTVFFETIWVLFFGEIGKDGEESEVLGEKEKSVEMPKSEAESIIT